MLEVATQVFSKHITLEAYDFFAPADWLQKNILRFLMVFFSRRFS